MADTTAALAAFAETQISGLREIFEEALAQVKPLLVLWVREHPKVAKITGRFEPELGLRAVSAFDSEGGPAFAAMTAEELEDATAAAGAIMFAATAVEGIFSGDADFEITADGFHITLTDQKEPA